MNFRQNGDWITQRQNGDWITQHNEEPKGFSHKLISVIGFLIIVVPIVIIIIGHYSK